jgi:aryl-alcohol dehydrogenase-like predicted oxidoreductase
MRYTTFGRTTGLRVSELALGAGMFGTRWGTGADPAESRKVFDRFADAGGTFIDTAESYQFGESEEFLGQLLAGVRSQFVVATKFTQGSSAHPDVMHTGNSRKNMTRAVEDSLRRLQTDYIDLLWVHFPDAVTPAEEIVRGLDDLTRQGKIGYGGLSNFPAWRTARAVTLAEAGDRSPIIGAQFEYSLAERTADREILPMAEALGLGGALWSPLAGGLLTGKYRTSDAGRLTELKRLVHTEDDAVKTATVDAVLAVAGDLGAPAAQVALAWLRERNDRSATAVVPVIGPRNLAQLEDYLAALDVRLDDEQYRRLDEASRIPLGQPHDLINSRRGPLLGGDAGRFETPVVPVA